MKPRTFFRLAILFPYFLWVICALAVAILSSTQEISPARDAVVGVVFLYAFGILFWFVPYTILAIGLWIWSKGKPKAALHKLALVAPVLLVPLMVIEAALLSLPVDNIVELASNTLNQSALLGGFSLVFGYLCVGIALGVFRILQVKKLITEEAPTPLAEG